VNAPNALTLARIALVPLFVVLGYGDTRATAIASLVVFGVASGTDKLDGFLARRAGAVTRLGQFLDPLADKLLVGAALVVLVATRGFPLWAALVIALREAAVQWLRTRIVAGGGTLPATPAAQLKTALQVAMVAWWLLPWSEPNPGHWLWLAAGVGATVWSGLDYAHAGRKAGARAEAR
jgi:CDP-diacylglycerol--glycerol-3-phosphate 3-phosphatidyltransferase